MGGAALCPAAVAALACAAAVRAQPEGGAPFRRVFTANGGLAATWFDASYKGAYDLGATAARGQVISAEPGPGGALSLKTSRAFSGWGVLAFAVRSATSAAPQLRVRLELDSEGEPARSRTVRLVDALPTEGGDWVTTRVSFALFEAPADMSVTPTPPVPAALRAPLEVVYLTEDTGTRPAVVGVASWNRIVFEEASMAAVPPAFEMTDIFLEAGPADDSAGPPSVPVALDTLPPSPAVTVILSSDVAEGATSPSILTYVLLALIVASLAGMCVMLGCYGYTRARRMSVWARPGRRRSRSGLGSPIAKLSEWSPARHTSVGVDRCEGWVRTSAGDGLPLIKLPIAQPPPLVVHDSPTTDETPPRRVRVLLLVDEVADPHVTVQLAVFRSDSTTTEEVTTAEAVFGTSTSLPHILDRRLTRASSRGSSTVQRHGSLHRQRSEPWSSADMDGWSELSSASALRRMPSRTDPGSLSVVLEDELELFEALGSGAVGTVYRAVWRGSPVAVKIIHGQMSDEDLEKLRLEVEVLRQLRHPRIVSLLGASTEHDRQPCLITELMTVGSLHRVLHVQRLRPTVRTLLILAEDVASACDYLHQLHVLHRDLKSHNVLISEDGHAKVADFGIARKLEHTFLSTTAGVGTCAYMAPETFLGTHVSFRSDVFSFAVLLWEMVTGEEPWAGVSSPLQIVMAVGVEQQRLPIPADCPRPIARLIAECWHHNPDARPDFAAIRQHIADIA